MPARSHAEADPLVEAVRAALYAFPHLRLGQLICNVTKRAQGGGMGDPYYVTDEVLLLALREYTRNGGQQ